MNDKVTPARSEAERRMRRLIRIHNLGMIDSIREYCDENQLTPGLITVHDLLIHLERTTNAETT